MNTNTAHHVNGWGTSRTQRTNLLKPCVICLYRTGLGVSKIQQLTRIAKSVSFRWVRKAGLLDPNRLKEAMALKSRKTRERIAALPPKPPKPQAKTKDPTYSRRKSLEYYHKNKRKIYDRNRTKPEFIVAQRARLAVYRALKKCGTAKSQRTMVLTGCTPTQLANHIELQFVNGMSWNNRHLWHIDHRLPCASFNLTNPDHQRACFHYTNLQPLWAKDNLMKSDKIITTQPQLCIPL